MRLQGQANNVAALERVVSIATGAFLVTQTIRRPSWRSAAGGLLGADLIYRGATGHCHLYSALGVNTAEKKKPGSQIDQTAPAVHRSITIARSPEELYSFWRDEHNLARIMAHFAEVTPGPDSSTHWRVRGPVQQVFEWHSRLISDEPGHKIAWETLPGTEIPNRGEVVFKSAPDGMGSEVSLQMQFEPPLGAAGARLIKALNKVPRAVAGKALRRFKSLVETGEIPTLEHNPSGRGSSDFF